MILRPSVAILLLVLVLPVWACTPPPPREDSGFVRPGVNRLPKNARGVMFHLASGKAKPQDFSVKSTQDKRPLAVRVRSFKSLGWVRIELAHGFQPNARYEFRYLPTHGNWRYADHASVEIEDAVAEVDGGYSIELTSRPVHQVILVPSSGPCVEPSPAIVQEFTYKIPPSLLHYGDVLDYGASISLVSSAAGSKHPVYVGTWPEAPDLYVSSAYTLDMGFSEKYTARNNAVVASCDARHPPLKLSGTVGFPEVDTRYFRTPVVKIDMVQTVGDQCSPLDALVQTVNWKSPERSLRELCHMAIASAFTSPEADLRAVRIEEWERALSFFYGMSSTCNLVGLAHLWHTGQYSTQPETLHRIGMALKSGLTRVEPAQQSAVVRGLIYLVDQLPAGARSKMARQLLSPIQPLLVDFLAASTPTEPVALAALIIHSGKLAPALRLKVRRIAESHTPTAPAAQKVLNTALD